jgi:hypothetical protein
MDEAPENGKESSHSAHDNGKNDCCYYLAATVINSIKCKSPGLIKVVNLTTGWIRIQVY